MNHIQIRQTTDLSEARPLLELAVEYDTGGDGGNLTDMIAGCLIFEVIDRDVVVGAFAARALDYSDGRVLTVTAAGGRPGYDLVGAIEAWMHLQAAGPAGARALVCTTRRPGLVKRLKKAGYHVAGYVMRKEVRHGVA